MALKENIQMLANTKGTPCVTISFDTHRTFPDNTADGIMLKKMIKEAEVRVLAEFDKKSISGLLDNLSVIASEIDMNYNLDSLHVFLSNNRREFIRSSWKTSNEGVHISDSFAVRSIIKSYTRSDSYLVVLLSQSGVHLYEALNDEIVQEIKNGQFPIPENPYFNSNPEKITDQKYLDNLVREFFNKVDKALVSIHHETDLNFVVICTADNYSKLLQVADKPSVYLGFAAVNYNSTAPHQIVKQSWEIVKSIQRSRRTTAINDMKEAVGQGKVLTDLQEIYQAAIDGRAELLIVHQDFSQPVIMKNERTFDIIDDANAIGAIDDITSNIAWEVISRKGKVYFTAQEEIKDLGKIVLKTRY
ncbi:MAG: hypothetical protein KF880_06975 [Ferruginibacter sp.]|nr:hypothetical protein [Ferruginibacter sp.]